VMPVGGEEHHHSHWEAGIWDLLRPGSQHGGAGKFLLLSLCDEIVFLCVDQDRAA